VYLLLFPAVAIYYYLIPVYAGRRLVAGNVIAVAWVIAVIANVVVWAHHVYIDYPENTPQAAINTAMQPLTFALTIPSALSLYSIGFTIWRSRFRWTAASTALFLGAVGWLLAGLSGVVNATIALDRIVHNTLWIVGHFHHMALLNMGLVIFGATYHFLPELTGKALRSEAAAKWHVWLTFLAGTGLFVPWLVQGLQGAPRRFSVLPDGAWDGLTVASVPFVFVLALAQLLFFWNVVQTVRGVSGTVEEAAAGEARRVRRPRRGWQPVTVEAAAVLVAVAIAVGFGVGGWLIGRGQRTEPAPAPAPAPAAPAEPAEAVGRDAFETANCGGCHTLAKAGATGQVGPSLDTTALTEAEIAQVVANGRNTMPAFAGQLTDEQIGAVAAFVAQDP
jgi:heme/copper-type cytochrome/quinol oxidase subunit 1